MPVSIRSVALVFSVALLSFSVLSCSRDLPEAPSISSALSTDRAAEALVSTNGLYYPLQQGTTWHVSGDIAFRTKNTSGVVLGEAVVHQDYVRTIIGTEERLGRTYTILEEHRTDTGDVPNPPNLYTYWYRYRQDGSGLYQLFINVNTPPGGTPPEPGAAATAPPRLALPDRLLATVPLEQQAAYRAAWDRLEKRVASARSSAGPPSGGVLDGEFTELRYPLYPGQTWTYSTDPAVFIGTVEAVEQLEVAAGRFTSQRIRWDNSILNGPHDRLTTWVSRGAGELLRTAHFESVIYSQYGFPIGTLEFDAHEEVQDVALVTP